MTFFGWVGLIHRKAWEFFWLQQFASCLRAVPIFSNHPFHLLVSRQVRKARLQQKMNQAAAPVETLFTAHDGIPQFQFPNSRGLRPLPLQMIMPFLEGSEGEQFLPGKCGEGNAMGWNGSDGLGKVRK